MTPTSSAFSVSRCVRATAYAVLLGCASLPAWAQKLSLSETASASIAHNEMTARLFIERSGEDLSELNRAVGQTLKRALALKSPQALVSSEGVHTHPVYDRNGRTNRYTVRATVSVKGTDLEAVSQTTEKLAAFMGFEAVQFGVSPQVLRDTRIELGQQAAKAFMHRAQLMAKALGYKEARLVEGSLDAAHEARPPVMPMLAKARPMAMAADASVEMGLQQGAGQDQVVATFSGTVELVR